MPKAGPKPGPRTSGFTSPLAAGRLIGLVLICCVACDAQPDDDPPLPTRSLVDHRVWQVVPLADSPFEVPTEARPCPLGDTARYEDLGGEPTFAVETLDCDYATVSQPLLTRLDQGESVSLRFWNFQLTRPAGSTAKVVVQLDNDVIWQTEIEIPSPSGLTTSSWIAPQRYPKGTPIYFHVKNHGQNEYNLVEVIAEGSP